MDEIQELMDVADKANRAGSISKTFAQLLAENPQQKGGLAQLASEEQKALELSTVGQPNPSQQPTSGLTV